MKKHYEQTIILDVLKIRNEGRTSQEVEKHLGSVDIALPEISVVAPPIKSSLGLLWRYSAFVT